MEPRSSFLEIPNDVPGYDMDALKVDQAYLSLYTTNIEEPLYLYSLTSECVGCPYTPIGDSLSASMIDPLTNGSVFTINTKLGWSFFVSNLHGEYVEPFYNGSDSLPCVKNVSLGEFGVYEWQISDEGCHDIETVHSPVFIYGGLILCTLIYLLLLGLIAAVPLVVKRIQNTGLALCWRSSSSDIQDELGSDDSAEKKETVKMVKKRVKSLDTFRGLSIVLMIFVNYGAGSYWFFEHAAWDGLLVADLVFPWFMWIMGVCIPMGIRSSNKRGVPKIKAFKRIFVRSLKLFALGIVLNSLGGWVVLANYRVPGVLQRFAICYLVVATAMLCLPEIKIPENKVLDLFKDILSAGLQWLLYSGILAAHVIIMYCLPVPDCPTGYIGAGGLNLVYSEGESKPECIGGATGYIDRWVVGVEHLYQNPTAKHIYKSGAFDPEGVLGSMTSIFQVFLGLVAGNILHHYKGDKERMIRWVVWGVICGVTGAILCEGGAVDAVMPVNKNLWSVSYVMVTSCFAFFLLAFFYLLVDKLEVWSGTPLYQSGMNSIFLYAGHSLTYNLFPWHYIIGPMRTHVVLLVECLWGTTLWVLTALYLHHKGKFYTI